MMYCVTKTILGGTIQAKRVVFLCITLAVSRMGSTQVILEKEDESVFIYLEFSRKTFEFCESGAEFGNIIGRIFPFIQGEEE